MKEKPTTRYVVGFFVCCEEKIADPAKKYGHRKTHDTWSCAEFSFVVVCPSATPCENACGIFGVA